MMLGMLLPIAAGNELFADVHELNPQIYPLYKRTYDNRHKKEGLKIADSLFTKAAAINDVSAQCYALSVPISYYFNTTDDKAMKKAVNRLKDFSSKYNSEHYYYFACLNYINFLLNNNHQYSALDYANKTQSEAEHKNSKYGLFVCKRAIANIHFNREELEEAKKNYIEALEYANSENIRTNSYSVIYFRLATCCNEMKDYDEALKYARLGYSQQQGSDDTKLRSKTEACIALFFLGEKDKFYEIYNQIKDKYSILSSTESGMERFAFAEIINALYNKNYDHAVTVAKSIKDILVRGQMLTLIYRYKKDYKLALESYTRWNIQRDSLNNVMLQQDLADQEELTGNHLLKEETQRIELMNAQLQLTNSTLELDKAKKTADAARINAENNRLGIKNKKLEAQTIKALMEKQALEQQEKDVVVHNYRVRMFTILGAISALLILAAIYLMFRLRISKKLNISNARLKQQNEDLNEARERAEQADKMKTMFIQNMSHEIRTPLNAIVGFSQLLAEGGDDISSEEKADFSNRIEQSSDLVLNIINDILDLSTIESGHYKMIIESTKVNDICRTALYNVKSRIPSGVELKFTTDVSDDYTIETDSKRVLQVIINFLTNAAKNTTQGHIHLHCSTSENVGYLSFSVADTGVGIAPEKMDLIFERFRKLDDMKQGSGLGLSICSIITERLNGLIYIDKTYLNGAKFVFAIPQKNANITPPRKYSKHRFLQ